MNSSATDALVVVSGPMAGQTLPLERRELVVGRDPNNDVPLTAYTQLSRRHAKLVPTPDGWSIEDLNSTNGVLLNGTRLPQSALKHGDRLKLGDFEALVRVYNVAPVSPQPSSSPANQERAPKVEQRPPFKWVWPALGVGIVLVIGGLLWSGRGSRSGSGAINDDADVQAKARRAIDPGSSAFAPGTGQSSNMGPIAAFGDNNPAQAGNLAPPVNGRIAPRTVALAKNATVMIVHSEGGGNYSFGSGFVSGNGRQVITNRHVVAEGGQAQDCTLIFGAGTLNERKVNVSASSIKVATGDSFASDLAVLSLPAEANVPAALPLGQSEELNETDSTWVFGFPLGVETLTLDRELPSVSVKDANIERIQRGQVDGREEAKVLQLGSTVTHGNSGGPVLNAKGEVVGVISLGSEGGISYAIPTVWVRRLLL